MSYWSLVGEDLASSAHVDVDISLLHVVSSFAHCFLSFHPTLGAELSPPGIPGIPSPKDMARQRCES